MKNMDWNDLRKSKHWRCDRNKEHILGVIERVQVNVLLDDGSTLKYYTTRLLIFRAAVDLRAEAPAKIAVAGTLDGKMLSMTWECSVPGCECIKEWHPDEGALEWLKKRYASQREGV